jgi:hypothetical protein
MYNKKQQQKLPIPFIIEKEQDPLYKNGLEKGREEAKQRTISTPSCS